MSTLTDTFQAIADAIRAKTGKSDTMTPAEMPGEIADISGGGQITQIEAFESGSVSLLATNGVTISSYTINEDMSADITFSESSAGYEGCILQEFANITLGKDYLVKFNYEFDDVQWLSLTSYYCGCNIVTNPTNDYEDYNQFNNMTRDSSEHTMVLHFRPTALNTNLVFNVCAMSDSWTNSFKIKNLKVFELSDNI